MDIKTIGVEEWLNVWEKSATWDIAQSTISSLTMGELRARGRSARGPEAFGRGTGGVRSLGFRWSSGALSKLAEDNRNRTRFPSEAGPFFYTEKSSCYKWGRKARRYPLGLILSFR